MPKSIQHQLEKSAEVIRAMGNDPALIQKVEKVAQAALEAMKNGHKLMFMGNGGSAADAQHFAAEMVCRFAYDRPGLPALALSTDTSVLTAMGNDYGFESIFSRQVEALGRPGDVLFGISTSGRSPNILKAMETGKKMGLVTVGLTGAQESPLTKLSDHCLHVPSDSTPRIQEGHAVVGHILCGLIEAGMFPQT